MKKIIILLLLMFFLFVFGCGKKEESDSKRSNDIESSENVRPYQKLKEEDFHVDKFKDEEIPLVFMEKLYRLKHYTKETIGETVATMIIKYTQKIHNVYTQTEDEKHLITKSNSSLVNVYHEAYFDDMVKVRNDDDDEFVMISYDEYNATYGFMPFSFSIEGFDLVPEAIISSEKVGDYQYKVVIDASCCSKNVNIQMKKFGKLTDDVEFKSVEMIITMKEDFTPITIDYKSEYVASVGIKSNCVQSYVVTYTILD